MALSVKQIAAGQLTVNQTKQEMTSAVASDKAQIIKNMRFVNTHATIPITFSVYLFKGTAGQERLVSPQNVQLSPNAMYVDDQELTLEKDHKLVYSTGSSGGPIDFVISGVERDQA
jgi:hypothetical protein